MASPRLEVFAVYDALTGVPKTGYAASLVFSAYKTDLGVDVTPQPAIIEIGGGLYGFLPVFADLARGIAYIVSTTGASPAYVSRYMRPEDWRADDIDIILGLCQDNFVGDQMVFSTAGLLLSARARLFRTKADAQAGTDAFATFRLTVVESTTPGLPDRYELVQES